MSDMKHFFKSYFMQQGLQWVDLLMLKWGEVTEVVNLNLHPTSYSPTLENFSSTLDKLLLLLHEQSVISRQNKHHYKIITLKQGTHLCQ